MADESKTPSAQTAVSGAPSSWPGAFGAYKYSKAAVMVNIWTLVIIWLIVAIINGIGESSLGETNGGLIGLLVSSLATVAYVLTFLAGIRGQKLSIGDALSKAFPLWLKMIGLMILVSLSLIGSLLLLVIPFFFVLPRLSLAHYYLIDKNLGVMDAYKTSWNNTKGNSGKIWGIIGANFAMALLVITIIGIPFAIYFLVMYSAAFAVFYEFLSKSKPAAAPATSTPAPAKAA